MTRLLFVLLAGLALTACRTEPPAPAAPEDAPAAEVDVDAKAESDPFGEPERVEGAASATLALFTGRPVLGDGFLKDLAATAGLRPEFSRRWYSCSASSLSNRAKIAALVPNPVSWLIWSVYVATRSKSS